MKILFLDPYKIGFSEDGIYQSEKYSSLYTLVTNVEKRSVPDLFERALSASVILFYLCTHTNIFGKTFSPNMQEISSNLDATYVGGLIMRNLQIIPCNIHSVRS